MALLALATTAIAALLIYYLTLLVYRLYLHPLAKFPGSKIAAASLWYEFYYDVILRGQFIWKIQEWHERYGPIIRINPNELHIDDPDYYDEIYGSTSRKRDKYAPWVVSSATPGASFATVGHDHHKMRRSALNPFFSTKAVTELEPVLKSKVELLASRFQQAQMTGEVIRLDAAFMALTFDIICQYSFANGSNMLAKDDFNLAWKELLITLFEGGALLRQFPYLNSIMKAVPDGMMRAMIPSMNSMLDWETRVKGIVAPIVNRTESVTDIENATHRTIFHELRDSSLPASEKTIDRLVNEATILTGAGSETTAKASTVGLFYLLQEKKIFWKLKEELKAKPDADSWTKLTQLPYLASVIAEALRLSLGVTTRLPRVPTEEILTYKEWQIPFGTPVSSTAYFILMNSTIFPNPTEFRPERWIDDAGKFDHKLEKKYLINFGRGSRQCLGMNLAYAEMYLTLATLVRRFDMELFETTVDDVTMAHDFFVAIPRLDSKGIRIKVTGLT
ncbi:Cytochrome P450 monooxygenase sdnE [Lachnellula suecica]|uniref:Cytochrome P450 monooxygenase sdnE n=1 Tax=Lachnellula suecica TaxID=602035 RepID=A0A8T9C2A0_9HELO|nr:Cytochrome P450 monooxygenase sdnE [Lachnellula suecica]